MSVGSKNIPGRQFTMAKFSEIPINIGDSAKEGNRWSHMVQSPSCVYEKKMLGEYESIGMDLGQKVPC